MTARSCGVLVVLACFLGMACRGANAQKEPPSSKYGVNVSLQGMRLFHDDNPWNQDISQEPVDPNSDVLIGSIGRDKPLHPDFGTVYRGAPNGIPYVVVDGKQPKVAVEFQYADESDPGPYPIPPNAPIEGGPKGDGDRHIIILDRDNWKLYEIFKAYPVTGGWKAGSGAIFDLKSNKLRPQGWTSADAAGLPILPGLVRYDEVFEQKKIEHALRFTVEKSRRAFVPPATHYASPHTDAKLPPMGMRVRLKAGFNMDGYPGECQVILKALQKFGMFVADNGGDWFLGGVPDPGWSDDSLHTLKKVKGRDFEVVRMGTIITK